MKRAVATPSRRRAVPCDPLVAQFEAACRTLQRAGLRMPPRKANQRHVIFSGWIIAEVYHLADRASGEERRALLTLAAACRQAADGELRTDQTEPLRAAVASLRELPL